MPMQRALELAREAYACGEIPVGAVVVDASGVILAEAYNLTETSCNPAGHAEVLALQQAAKKLSNPRLLNCDLYVTLEPCPMCAQAISFARIRKLVFGAYDLKGGGVAHGARIFEQTSCHHKPEVVGGVEELQSAALLRQFFAERRRAVQRIAIVQTPSEAD